MDWETALDRFVHGDSDGEYEPPRIPKVLGLEGMIQNSNCSEPFEKELTKSDLSRTPHELVLHKSDVEKCLLPLLNGNEDIRHGIPVDTYNIYGRKYQMVFLLRPDKNCYVLNNGWLQFANDNEFRVKEYVTIWMFRHVGTGNLCFVVEKSGYFLKN